MQVLSRTGKLPFTIPSSLLAEPSVLSQAVLQGGISGRPPFICHLSPYLHQTSRSLTTQISFPFPTNHACSLNHLGHIKLPKEPVIPRDLHSSVTIPPTFIRHEALEVYRLASFHTPISWLLSYLGHSQQSWTAGHPFSCYLSVQLSQTCWFGIVQPKDTHQRPAIPGPSWLGTLLIPTPTGTSSD